MIELKNITDGNNNSDTKWRSWSFLNWVFSTEYWYNLVIGPIKLLLKSFSLQSSCEIVIKLSRAQSSTLVVVDSAAYKASASVCPLVFSIEIRLFPRRCHDTSRFMSLSVLWTPDEWRSPSSPCREMWLSKSLSAKFTPVGDFWPRLRLAGIPSGPRPLLGWPPSTSPRLPPSSGWLWRRWQPLIWPNAIASSLRRCDTRRRLTSSRIVPLRLGPGTLSAEARCRMMDGRGRAVAHQEVKISSGNLWVSGNGGN